MATLPILLVEPHILLIGGGRVALHKAHILQKNSIHFTLIAPQICEELLQMDIPQNKRELRSSDLDQASILIDATGNPDVACLVMEKKKQRHLLFNCVDKPELCDFYFSSLLNYGNLKIAVSTDGGSPTVGQMVRNKIATLIPSEIQQILEGAKRDRDAGNLDVAALKTQCNKMFSTVYFINCDLATADLLTNRVCCILRQVDMVLFDHRVHQDILALIPPQTEQISLAEQPLQIDRIIQNRVESGGEVAVLAYSTSVAATKKMVNRLIKQGIRVERLDSGTPYY